MLLFLHVIAASMPAVLLIAGLISLTLIGAKTGKKRSDPDAIEYMLSAVCSVLFAGAGYGFFELIHALLK